jgi:type I restriction enzyme S subunit
MVASLFATAPLNACPAYSNLRSATDGFGLAAREHCDDLWRDFAVLADENFVSAFPFQLHERWFEMYLAVGLLRAGLNVSCPKPGPDVLLMHGGRRIWIEATCATPGVRGLPDSVPEPRYWKPGEGEPEATDRPTGAMTLRIRNSLDAKERVFASYVANGIVPPGDITMIAINVHAIPNAWADMDDLMRRTLYGLGDLMISIHRETRKVLETMHADTPTISKKSGAVVNVNAFSLGGSMSHISAVLGSREDCANRPARLGDGFAIYPNLNAASSWPAGTIQLGEEWIPTQLPDGSVDLNKTSYLPQTNAAAATPL